MTSNYRFFSLLSIAALLAWSGCSEKPAPAGNNRASRAADWNVPKEVMVPVELPPATAKPPSKAEPFKYDPAANYQAVVKTTLGTFRLAFQPKTAPLSVETFIKAAAGGFYNGQIVYRVLADTLIGSGDSDGTGFTSSGLIVPDEFAQSEFVAGTVGLSHDANPNSGGSQWFVCLRPMPQLDHKFNAFARVTDGLDVVRKISNLPVIGSNAVFATPAYPALAERPVDPPIIQSIEIIKLSDGPSSAVSASPVSR
jgi:cyclophilin family peptidyl-prolyl cis-trans isomerase